MTTYYTLSPNETSAATADTLVENEKPVRSSLLSPPANDVILGEEQVPRDQIKKSQLARDAQFFDSSTMAERIRYVAHCLDEVQANIRARERAPKGKAGPEEELAYAVQTIQAKLQAGALSKDDVVRARDLLQQAQLSEREVPAQRQPKRSHEGQFLVAEDTVESGSDVVAKKQTPAEFSLFQNYDSLKTFEERLEYVYTCLKKVEEKKLQQLRTDGYVQRNPGPDSEEAAYALAHEQAVHEVAKTILSQSSSKSSQSSSKSLKSKL